MRVNKTSCYVSLEYLGGRINAKLDLRSVGKPCAIQLSATNVPMERDA